MDTLSSVILAASAGVHAAEAADAADAESSDRTIVVTGLREAKGYVPGETLAAKIPAELRDIPQTVDVVPEALLRDQRALSIQDALKNVPGVGLSHGDGQRDQVTIRGFSAISDQFVDGFRDDALYFRDLSNIERIEVIKGPAAVLLRDHPAGIFLQKNRLVCGQLEQFVAETQLECETRSGWGRFRTPS